MTEESRVSRTPRTWAVNSDEPIKQTGVELKVRDRHGDVWTYNDRNGLWYSPETDPFPWDRIALRWGPLVEVLPDALQPTAERDYEDIFPPALAERCYYEGCPEWITGSSDYCPNHEQYGPVPVPASSPKPSSVLPSPQVSGERGKGSTEALARLIFPEVWAAEEADQDTVGAQWRISEGRWLSKEAAARVLAAGWRPSADEETP